MPGVSGKPWGAGTQTSTPREGRRKGLYQVGEGFSTGVSPTPASSHREWPAWPLHVQLCLAVTGTGWFQGKEGRPVPTRPCPVQWHAKLNKVQMAP